MRINHGAGLRIGNTPETQKEAAEKDVKLSDVDLGANQKEYETLLSEIHKVMCGTYFDKMTWKDFNKEMIKGINILSGAVKHMKQSYEYYYLTGDGMAEFKKLEAIIVSMIENIFETKR